MKKEKIAKGASVLAMSRLLIESLGAIEGSGLG